jgi:DNA-directed RNA polymerase specialized sigma24 family protein
MDYAEIADELGIGVEAVAARKERLIERLKKLLADAE